MSVISTIENSGVPEATSNVVPHQSWAGITDLQRNKESTSKWSDVRHAMQSKQLVETPAEIPDHDTLPTSVSDARCGLKHQCKSLSSKCIDGATPKEEDECESLLHSLSLSEPGGPLSTPFMTKSSTLKYTTTTPTKTSTPKISALRATTSDGSASTAIVRMNRSQTSKLSSQRAPSIKERRMEQKRPVAARPVQLPSLTPKPYPTAPSQGSVRIKKQAPSINHKRTTDQVIRNAFGKASVTGKSINEQAPKVSNRLRNIPRTTVINGRVIKFRPETESWPPLKSKSKDRPSGHYDDDLTDFMETSKRA